MAHEIDDYLRRQLWYAHVPGTTTELKVLYLLDLHVVAYYDSYLFVPGETMQDKVNYVYSRIPGRDYNEKVARLLEEYVDAAIIADNMHAVNGTSPMPKQFYGVKPAIPLDKVEMTYPEYGTFVELYLEHICPACREYHHVEAYVEENGWVYPPDIVDGSGMVPCPVCGKEHMVRDISKIPLRPSSGL